jgi:hypothetical protein
VKDVPWPQVHFEITELAIFLFWFLFTARGTASFLRQKCGFKSVR